MNCPECNHEVMVVCSNIRCKCREGINEINMLIWTEDGNNQQCPNCKIIKHAGDWEDLFVEEFYNNKGFKL